jgi:low affinity Fe/Cu permease
MTTRPFIAIAVGGMVIVSWIVIAATGFDQDLQVAFGTVCAGMTVTMVFVLQHTQRREQTALNLKVNEIIRALPQADDHLIGVEASSDDEIVDIERSHQDRHTALRDDAPLYVAGVSDEPVMVEPAQRAITRVDQFAPDEPIKARRKWLRR